MKRKRSEETGAATSWWRVLHKAVQSGSILRMEDLPDILALNVRRLRHARGITQEELAHLASMDRSYLGGIERAKHKATITMIGRLAMALKVLPRDLLELPPNHSYLSQLSDNP